MLKRSAMFHVEHGHISRNMIPEAQGMSDHTVDTYTDSNNIKVLKGLGCCP